MRLKKPKSAPMTAEDAENLAAGALAFLASEPSRLVRFLGDSGLEPGELAANAGEAHILAAVLDHLCADESLLLVFASDKQMQPEQVVAAQVLLSGPRPDYSP